MEGIPFHTQHSNSSVGNITTSSPNSHYLSAPSSPPTPYPYPISPPRHRSNFDLFFFYSAPTTPNHAIPFSWEHSPGVPKSHHDDDDNQFQFDFNAATPGADSQFSPHKQQYYYPSISTADELFHAGKILPLKPPPGLSHQSITQPKSPQRRSPISKKVGSGFSSPKRLDHNQSNDFVISTTDDDPFEAALERTRKSNSISISRNDHHRESTDRVTRSGGQGGRSLSPPLTPPPTSSHNSSNHQGSSWWLPRRSNWRRSRLLPIRKTHDQHQFSTSSYTIHNNSFEMKCTADENKAAAAASSYLKTNNKKTVSLRGFFSFFNPLSSRFAFYDRTRGFGSIRE